METGNTRRRKAQDGEAIDAFSGRWRHYLNWQRGELARIKRRNNKRERREGRREAKEQ